MVLDSRVSRHFKILIHLQKTGKNRRSLKLDVSEKPLYPREHKLLIFDGTMKCLCKLFSQEIAAGQKSLGSTSVRDRTTENEEEKRRKL